MPQKIKGPTADSAPKAPAKPREMTTEQRQQQHGRRLAVEHRRLKVAFADAYVELIGIREENGRLNELLQEAQRVIREMSEKLPKGKPKAAAKS